MIDMDKLAAELLEELDLAARYQAPPRVAWAALKVLLNERKADKARMKQMEQTLKDIATGTSYEEERDFREYARAALTAYHKQETPK